jgi:hypothetical protein
MIGPINTGWCGTNDCTSGYIYSTYTDSMGLVAVDHRGHFFAPIDGDYTFSTGGNDNIVDIWIGPNALSGWTQANANLESLWPNAPASVTLTLSAAEWVPIRVFWANGGGPGTFSITIMAPDGTELIGSDMTSSPYLVQYSCDSIWALSSTERGNLDLELDKYALELLHLSVGRP